MKIITHAPMLAIFAGLLGGLAVFEKFGACVFFLFVPLILIAVALCSYESCVKDSWKMLVFMIMISLFCSLRIYNELTKQPEEIKTFRDSEGVISSVRSWGKAFAATIDVEGKKYVFIMPFRKFSEGMRLRFTGVTNNFRPKNGNFDEAKFWKARAVNARITIIESELLPIKFSIYRLRFLISRFIRKNIPELTSQYLRAACLGECDRSLNLKHQKWGTSHLLAVSGFHVGIVILCAGKIFGRKNNFIISIILWSYIFLTGASASALRAGLMIQIAIISRIFARPVNWLNTVSLAGVILLLDSPFFYWDIGWRLSFITSITLVALLKIKFGRKYSYLIMSPLIALTTFPQVTFAFRKIPLVGIFLNLFAPLFFSIGFPIASLGAFFKFLGVPFADIFLNFINGAFLAWEEFSRFSQGIIPDYIHANFLISWLGAGLLNFIVYKGFKFSNLRGFSVALALTFMSFIILG